MILHDVPNNTKLIKISASTFDTKSFFENDLNALIIPVPNGIENMLPNLKIKRFFNHFLSKIMINSEIFLSSENRAQSRR